MYVSIYIPISLSKSTTYVITFTSKYQIIKLELQFKLTKYLHCIFTNFTYPTNATNRAGDVGGEKH